MNLPNLTPERAKELRALADHEKLMAECLANPLDAQTRFRNAIALRDFAQLIDTVLDGGDVVTKDMLDKSCTAYTKACGEAAWKDGLRAALTAALPAIRLRLLADTAKEGK